MRLLKLSTNSILIICTFKKYVHTRKYTMILIFHPSTPSIFPKKLLYRIWVSKHIILWSQSSSRMAVNLASIFKVQEYCHWYGLWRPWQGLVSTLIDLGLRLKTMLMNTQYIQYISSSVACWYQKYDDLHQSSRSGLNSHRIFDYFWDDVAYSTWLNGEFNDIYPSRKNVLSTYPWMDDCRHIEHNWM